MNIGIEIDGIPQTIAALSRVERGVLDLRQLGTWDWVESEFRRIQKEIFDSEGSASAGGKWKRLSPAYAAVKQKKYGNLPILQRTGGMYKEFTSKGGGAVEQKPQEMSIAFSSPAGFHMGKGARSKMPYRSSLDLTNEQKERLMKPIRAKFQQLVDNAGLRDRRGF
jgi:hypothetical protein